MLRKLIIAVAAVAILMSGEVFAYTECPDLTLTKTHLDLNGDFFIATGGYLNGMIPKDGTSNFSQGIAIALAARTSEKPITVRYANDGVVCGSAAWNEVIISIIF